MTKKTSTPIKTLKPQSSKPDFFILPFFFFSNHKIWNYKNSKVHYLHMHIWSFSPPFTFLKIQQTKHITKLLNFYSYFFLLRIFSKLISYLPLPPKAWTPSPHHHFHASFFPPKVPHHHLHVASFSHLEINFTKSWTKWSSLNILEKTTHCHLSIPSFKPY